MDEKIEILTKVFGFVNRMKIALAFWDVAGVWKVVNELSDYIVNVEVAPTLHEVDAATDASVELSSDAPPRN